MGWDCDSAPVPGARRALMGEERLCSGGVRILCKQVISGLTHLLVYHEMVLDRRPEASEIPELQGTLAHGPHDNASDRARECAWRQHCELLSVNIAGGLMASPGPSS